MGPPHCPHPHHHPAAGEVAPLWVAGAKAGEPVFLAVAADVVAVPSVFAAVVAADACSLPPAEKALPSTPRRSVLVLVAAVAAVFAAALADGARCCSRLRRRTKSRPKNREGFPIVPLLPQSPPPSS